jgi:hypothetical protein
MTKIRKLVATALAGAVAFGGVVGFAASAQAADSNTVVACVSKKTGAMKYSSTGNCKKGYTKVTWNVAGPTGPAGPAGPGSQVMDGNGNPVKGIVFVYSDMQAMRQVKGSTWWLDFATGTHRPVGTTESWYQDSNGWGVNAGLFADAGCTVPAVKATDLPGNAAVQRWDAKNGGGLTYVLSGRVAAIPFYKSWDNAAQGYVCSQSYKWDLATAKYVKDFTPQWLFRLDLNRELRQPDALQLPVMAVATD